MDDPRNLTVFIAVIAARLFVPLAIPKYPIPAGIAALVIDGVDQTMFQSLTTLDLAGYQSYDKALDVYYLAIAYLSTLRNWTNLPAFAMSRFLFYYRLVGSLLFELTQLRALLLLFPNTFEYFFLFYEGVRLRWNPKRMSVATVIGAAFAIWVFIKVPQEYWIHIAQLDVTDAIKSRVFGVPLDTPWSTIVSENLAVWIGAVVALAAFAVAARWAVDRYLPPADWRFSFDADAHGHDVTDEEVMAVRREHARTLWDAELFEKFALVSLMTIVFSQILPGLRATPMQTAIGVGVVILANTIVSEWFVRRGVTWQSIFVEFGAMALTNAAAAVIFVIMLPIGGGRLDAPATFFILLLLTLLVTLYDRFRPNYEVRLGKPHQRAD
jgi:hypothetical protein